MSRLSIEITPKQHQHIKSLAAFQGQSIKEYVLSRLFDKQNGDDEEWKEFVSLMKKRIDSARNNPPSTKTLNDIAQDIIQRNS